MQLEKDDSLHDTKRLLLQKLQISQPAPYSKLELQTVLAAARVLCLRQAELKQLSGLADLLAPLNPRNEAAALALLLAAESEVCGGSAERRAGLQQLLAAYPSKPAAPGQAAAAEPQQQQQQQQSSVQVFLEESPEQQLLRWVLAQGGASLVAPATFAASDGNRESDPGALRGCAALPGDIPAGAAAVSLPAALLITYEAASGSDFGRALSRLGLDPESLAVVWTMVERWEPEAAARPFWAALPAAFSTGLSVPEPLIDLLKGLPAHAEFVRARHHVRQQFQQLQQVFSVLLQAYPSFLQAAWFSEAAYLWSVELWYAYAIQVKFPGGRIAPALAPFVSLLNHSPWPHIVHYSTVNTATGTLDLKTFRPVQHHQQAFLSYGPLPNEQLLLFYGFAVDNNPFEEVEVILPLDQQQQLPQGTGHAAAANRGAVQELLQQLGLDSLAFTLTVQQPLPPGLLPCLRAVCATAQELQQLQKQLQQLRTSAPSAATTSSSSAGGSGSGSSSGGSSSGGGSSKKKKKKQPGDRAAVSTPVTAARSAASSDEPLAAAWAAAEKRTQLLGQPLSDDNEAAARQLLAQLLQQARVPYQACLAKLERRQQLQAMLQQQQGSSGGAADGACGFVRSLLVFARGMLDLLQACSDAAGGAPP